MPRWLGYIVALTFGCILAAFLTARIAVGFPENIRAGYPSCAACHTAGVVGGGILTDYGRSAAAEMLSTWSFPGEEGALYGVVDQPDFWLSYGGDARDININRLSDTGQSSHLKFWMQSDVELAAHLRGVTVAASAGAYGPEREVEYRRSYVKLDVGRHMALRMGRFIPDYGIAFPDHTVATRAGLGLGEGQETYAAEASAFGEVGEVVVTGVYGRAAEIDGAADAGYDILREGKGGVVWRAAAYLGDRAQVGVSVMRLGSRDMYRHAYGMHALAGLTRSVYVLAEIDRRFEAGGFTDLGSGRLGWEVYRGLHLSLIGDFLARQAAGGGQVQWFPRPHFELLAQGVRTLVDGRYADTGLLLFHYYL